MNKNVAATLLAAALAGCAVMPELPGPHLPKDEAYTPESLTQTGDGTVTGQKIVLGAPVTATWWKLLRSSEIDQLVEMALMNNQTLDAARANLTRALEETSFARGSVGPQVSFGASAGRGHDVVPGQPVGDILSAYSVGPTLSYELPMFGRQQQTVAFAEAEARRSAAELSAAQLSISGNVVYQALEIAALRAQISALEKMINNGEENLTLLQQAQRAGAVAALDVISAQSQLDRDQALLPSYRERLKHAEIALTILVGKTPMEWRAPELSLDSISLPAELPVSVPSVLLRHRPDILAAEAQMAAAGAQVGIATANLYPQISLTADIGRQGVFRGGPSASVWNLIGGITAPIFNGGALSAQKRASVASYNGALAQYQHTVISAFGQVADAMYGLSIQAEALAAEQRASNSASASYNLTWQGYKAGNAGYVQVLITQRLQQQAALSLVQAQKQRLQASVTLLLASGAG
jgi:NodT family efflux transporter outer membrane factor (OMF) lipoprotein